MPIGDTWYIMTFNYLFAPLLCVAICLGQYWMMKKLMFGVLGVIVGDKKDKKLVN